MGKKIVVLGTGGTIAGLAPGERPVSPEAAGSIAKGDNRSHADVAARGAGHLGYQAAQLGVDRVLAAIPALQGVACVAEQVAQVDSKDMGPAVWQVLAARCAHWLAQDDVQGLVITHGTDTLEETAYFLHRVLAPAKPVVLTCAMRPADALAPDGPQNLADAVVVARSVGARGVVSVCAGQIHGPLEVTKVHPYRLDAFSSGESGPVGLVEEGVVRQLRPWPLPQDEQAPMLAARVAGRVPGAWPRVEIVLNHAGADGAMVQALVTAGARGLVVAGTGNGTMSEGLQAALRDAIQRGVAVRRSTRCALGQVLVQPGDAIEAAQGLSPVKARVALQLELLASQA